MSSSNPAVSSGRSSVPPTASRSFRWSISEIVVASVLAVASGVIFWGWNLSYHLIGNLFVFYPPVETLVHGMWLFPAVLGALVIRRPGAAIYCEMVAAAVSALLGSQWGLIALSSGFMQGLGAELVFLALFYRRFTLEFAMLAGAASGITGGITYHWIIPMYAYAPAETLIHISCFALSGVIFAGVLPWLATRGLAAASVLGPLGSRRAHREPSLMLGRSRG